MGLTVVSLPRLPTVVVVCELEIRFSGLWIQQQYWASRDGRHALRIQRRGRERLWQGSIYRRQMAGTEDESIRGCCGAHPGFCLGDRISEWRGWKWRES